MEANIPVYSIGLVEKFTQLSPRRIRYYEQAGLITTQRSTGNQRLYSPKNVEQLKTIKNLLEQGWSISGIKNHLQAQNKPVQGVVPMETFPSHGPLASLYPVNNQAELIRTLNNMQRR